MDKNFVISFIADELARIENPKVLSMTVEALDKAPNYLWEVPASSSGKYHPDSSLGHMGLIRHIKSVFRISEELLDNNTHTNYFADLSRLDLDFIRSAILLHDSVKQGKSESGNAPGTTVHEHPLLVREVCKPDSIEGDPKLEAYWNTICTMLESHMGEWNTRSGVSTVLPLPITWAQKHIHLCDYLASRKSIGVNIFAPISPKRSFPSDDKVVEVRLKTATTILRKIRRYDDGTYEDVTASDTYRSLFEHEMTPESAKELIDYLSSRLK